MKSVIVFNFNVNKVYVNKMAVLSYGVDYFSDRGGGDGGPISLLFCS